MLEGMLDAVEPRGGVRRAAFNGAHRQLAPTLAFATLSRQRNRRAVLTRAGAAGSEGAGVAAGNELFEGLAECGSNTAVEVCELALDVRGCGGRDAHAAF